MTNPTLVPFSGHNKLSALLSGPHYTLLDKAADLLSGLFDFTVPEGYEDESGFHLTPVRAESRVHRDDPVWLGEYI